MVDIETLALDSLPAVSFADRNSLTNCKAVYFALDAAGNVLYIGRTNTLKSRLLAHHRSEDLANAGCKTLAWLECEPKDLYITERAAIAKYKPPLNKPATRKSRGPSKERPPEAVSESMKRLGQFLREKREQLNLTQDEVAQAVGFAHKGNISRIENGLHKYLSVTQLEQFARVFGITLGELFTEYEQEEN